MAVNVKTLIVSACAMAFGASFGGVAYENLVLNTTDWFNATAGASSIAMTQAEWTLPTDYEWAYETVDSLACAEINTSLNAPVTLTSSTLNSASGLTKMSFDLIASTVPYGVDVDVPSGKAPAYGFAIKADDSTPANRNFYAYIGDSWVKLTGTVPEEGAAFTLTVIEDARSGFGKVQFRVGSVILADADDTSATWFDAGSRNTANGQVNIDLYGTGYFHQIDGDSQTITAAEIISGDNKKVVVDLQTESALEAAAQAGDVATLMTTKLHASGISGAPTAESALDVRDAYALGLVSVENSELKVKDDGVIVMKKGTQPTTADTTKIPLALNITPPEGAATVTFSLLGSNDGSAWTAVQSDKAADELAIPLTGTTYTYYKVQANITYASAAK